MPLRMNLPFLRWVFVSRVSWFVRSRGIPAAISLVLIDLDLGRSIFIDLFGMLISFFIKAYWETQQIEQEKARAKKEEKALQHWMKLVHGLRIRQRLQDQYADKSAPSKAGPSTTKSAKSRGASSRDRNGQDGEPKSSEADQDADEGLEPVVSVLCSLLNLDI